MNEFSDAEWIHSRKITVKSLARHFAPWKSRFFILDKANAALGIRSSSKGGLTIVPLSSPSLVIQRHEYGGEDQYILTLQYKEDSSPTIREIVMKFDSLEHLLYWEKGLKDAADSVKSVTASSTLALFRTLIEYLNEKVQLQTLEDNESQYEARYFDNMTLAEHMGNRGGDLPDDIDAAFISSSLTEPTQAVTEVVTTMKESIGGMKTLQRNSVVPLSVAPAALLRPLTVPRMHILLIAVGTRGDMQPFVQLGMRLRQDGHRVRVATHACFRKHVVEKGLEFYPLAGDPLKLSEFMVKTQGFVIPTSPELLMEAPIYHRMVVDMMYSCWGACVDPDPEDPLARKFVAEAIISNPVSYAHVHCAEALGIPMHLMFPQPWTPTKAFPHPLSCLSYKQGWSAENYISYQLVDSMMWMSFERHINAFRVNVLGLQPLRVGEGGWNHLNTMKVPFVKMWSPSFVPKPKDWPSHVDVVGTFFDNVAKPTPVEQEHNRNNRKDNVAGLYPPPPVTVGVDFTPSPELGKFLASGPAPIFVGFGSMVVKDLEGLISVFLEGAALAGARIIVQLGWSEISQERFMELALQAQFKASVVREAENVYDPLGSSLIFPSSKSIAKAEVTLTTTPGIPKTIGGLGDLSMSMRSVESSSTVDDGSRDESTLDGEALANASERAGDSNMYTSSLSASLHYPPSTAPRSNSSEPGDQSSTDNDFDLSPMTSSEYRKSQGSRQNSRDHAKSTGLGVAAGAGSGLGKWLFGAANNLSKSFQSSRPNDTKHTPTSSTPTSARLSGGGNSLRDDWDEVEVTGWSALKDAIFIGPCPHDWLFQQVAGVVHHGGAGTTAAGLRFGRPTWICPFFGDQHFWGEMVHRRRVGPKPCPIGTLTLQIVTDSLQVLQADETIAKAAALAENMSHEDGVEGACRAFYKHLPLENMLCDVSIFRGEYKMAQTYCQDCGLKMCREVSEVLHSTASLHMQDHRLTACCYKDWNRPAPHSAADGLLQGLGGLMHELKEGVSDLVYDPVHGIYTEGISGAATGLSSGLNSLLSRPLAGGSVLLNKVKEGIRASLSNNLNYGVAASAYNPMEEEGSLVDFEIASQPSVKGPNSTDSERRKKVSSLKSALLELPAVEEAEIVTPSSPVPLAIDVDKPLLLSSSEVENALNESRMSPCGRIVPAPAQSLPSNLLQTSQCTVMSQDSDAFYGREEAAPAQDGGVDSDGEDTASYEEDMLPFLLYTSKSDPPSHPMKPLSSTALSSSTVSTSDPPVSTTPTTTATPAPTTNLPVLRTPTQTAGRALVHSTADVANEECSAHVAVVRTESTVVVHNKQKEQAVTLSTSAAVTVAMQNSDTCSASTTATKTQVQQQKATEKLNEKEEKSEKDDEQVSLSKSSVEQAYFNAQAARKLFIELGARDGRFMAPRDLEKIVHLSIIRSTAGTQALDATTALATDCSGDQTMACAQTNSMTSTSTRSFLSPPSLNDRSLASLIQIVGHGKRYMDLMDFCLLYRELVQLAQSQQST